MKRKKLHYPPVNQRPPPSLLPLLHQVEVQRPTQIEDDLATSLKRKRAIERLRLTLLPVINEPGPPPVLAIDIDILDNFRPPTPEAEVIQTPIDNDITNKDYQSPVDSRFLTLPPAEEIAPRSYRPLPQRKPTIPQPPLVPTKTVDKPFGTIPAPTIPSTSPETVDVLLTDFPVKKWLDFRQDNLRLIGIAPRKQSLTGTSRRAAHILLWTVSCDGLTNRKGTTTMKSSDSYPRLDQQTTSPIYACALDKSEPHRDSQTKPAPSYQFDTGGTWMSSSGSSSNTYTPD